MLWLYLHFPQLQLDSLQRTAGYDQAVIVVNEQSHQVIQCNTPAREAGIMPGMGMATSASLCHELAVCKYDQEQEETHLSHLAWQLYTISAELCLFPPDGILTKVTPMLKLYGSVDVFQNKINAILTAQQVQFHYCFSPVATAARVLAKTGCDRVIDDTEATTKALASLPVTALALQGNHAEKLHRVGIHYGKQLFSLSRAELGQRFGQEMTEHLLKLQGKHPESFRWFSPPDKYNQKFELLFSADNTDALLFPLRRMLSDMEAFLTIRGSVVPALELVLTQREDHPEIRLTLVAAFPEDKSRIWLQLAQLKFEKLTLAAPVTHIALNADSLLKKQEPTLDLFSTQSGTLTPAELINLLKAKVGDSNIFSLSLASDHRPEKAMMTVPPLTEPAPLDAQPNRPTILFSEPKPLSRKPALIAGPERVSCGWWDKDAVKRDYYTARFANGQLIWVFRESDGRWYQHGVFC